MNPKSFQRQIKAYRTRKLSAEAHARFERTLQADSDLRMEYQLQLISDKAVEIALEDDLRMEMDKVVQHSGPVSFSEVDDDPTLPLPELVPEAKPARPDLLLRWLLLTAAAILVLLAVWWLYQMQGDAAESAPTTSSPVAHNDIERPGSDLYLGAEDPDADLVAIELPEANFNLGAEDRDADFKKAANTFNVKQDYAAAADQLTAIVRTDDPRRFEAEYLLGYARYMIGEYDAAAAIFRSFLEDEIKRGKLPLIYRNPAKLRWDLVLTFHRKGDIATARTILAQFPADTEPYYLEKVEALKSSLESGR